MTVDTGTGFPLQVLHRLALGVEPIDALRRLPIGPRVRVGREVTQLHGRRRAGGVLDPLARRTDLPLETNGTGRFKLRHGDGVGAMVLIRIDDPTRGYVPRRFEVPLWTLAEVEAPAGPYIPVRSRLLRPSLLPGSAYPAPRGTTGVRGSMVRNGQPVRWPRVEALGPGGLVVGRAHGDERGEFLLIVTGTGSVTPPPPATLDIQLLMYGPAGEPPDPALEPVTRSSAPPLPSDLDNPLLRGESIPIGYTVSSASPTVTVPIGELRSVPAPFTFWP
ncbi:MAG: hypothetical protein ACRDRA_14820 [Pseudonocardiaceae bacterium]